MEKQWIHGRVSPMLSVNGQNRRTNSEVEGFHSNFGKRMAQREVYKHGISESRCSCH